MNTVNSSVLSFPVVFNAIKEFEVNDTRFTKVQIRLMHLGENLNASYFDKEVVDNAIPSLAYIPIVGFIEDNRSGEEDFSDHRYVLTRTEDGLDRKYLGSAYGVILSSEDNNAHYEEIVCDDGETRTFLVVDGICWNMFEDSANILQNNFSRPQSMELQPDSIEGYEDENNVFHFTEFSFRASCILGEDFQPAMVNSTIEVFSVDGFLDAITKEIKEKYDSFVNFIEEGGKNEMDSVEKKKLDDDVLTVDDAVEEIVDEVADEIEEQTEEVEETAEEPVEENEEVAEEDTPEEESVDEELVEEVDETADESEDATEDAPVDDGADEDGEDGGEGETTYSLTQGDLLNEICKVLDEYKFTDEFGETYWKYWYVDIQDNEVIVYDAENGWNIYGIPYEMNGDAPVLSFENAKRKKVVYEDFEGDASEVKGVVNSFSTRMKQSVSRLSYDSLVEEFEEIKAQNEEYAHKEQLRLEAIEEARKEDELAKYELSLADSDEFNELKSNKESYSFEEIESKCAILFARKNIDAKNTNKGTAKARLVFEADEGDKDFVQTEKYGRIYKNVRKK